MGKLDNLESKREELRKLKKREKVLKKDVDYFNAMQLALKLVLNGSYGAISTKYFVLFNNKVAGAITSEGRKLTRTMSEVNEHYWYNIWHLDKELHNKLKIKNVSKIKEGISVSVYGDSVGGKTLINTDNGIHKIEDLYNMYNKSDNIGKEVILVNFKSLNWTKEEGLKYSNVKNIIRHKTTKAKWRLRAGGEEVIVTSDHSLVVFRNEEKVVLKPKDIKKGDKILLVLK